MKIGLFGGSFDPIHCGHLELARCCRTQAKLDEVWFTPAAQQPLKPQGPQAADGHRARMIELAIADSGAFRLCSMELERGGISYTVDTLRTIHQQQPATLFLMLGADAVADLPNWRAPEEILSLATLLVVRRAGEPARQFSLDAIEIDMPAVDVSSSEIRQRVATGQTLEGLVPPAVAAYITQNQLYL